MHRSCYGVQVIAAAAAALQLKHIEDYAAALSTSCWCHYSSVDLHVQV